MEPLQEDHSRPDPSHDPLLALEDMRPPHQGLPPQLPTELSEMVPASEGLPQLPPPTGAEHRSNPFTVSLFEGSPGYKQRKKKPKRNGSNRGTGSDDGWSGSEDESSRSDAGGGPSGQSGYPSGSVPSGQGDPYGGSGYAGPSVPHPGGLAYPQQQQQPQDSTAYGYSRKEDSVDDSQDGYQQQQINDWNQPPPPVAQPGPPSYPYHSGYPASQSPYPSVPISRYSQSPMPNIPIDAGSTAVETPPGTNGVLAGRMFRCPLDTCSRLFKRLEHLKRHVRTHTQERPYVCQRCHKRFSRSDNLTQHLKTHEKADRGERSMSTNGLSDAEMEYARLMGEEFAPGMPAVFHGGRGDFNGSSPFGDEASLYGSPAPPHIQRFGSVPPGFQPPRQAYDQGRFSMPPPSMGGSPHSDPANLVRMRSASYGHGIQPGLDMAPDGSPYMNHPQPLPMARNSRSPMPSVPQRAMSMQASGSGLGGSMRSVSQPGGNQRYAPYPNNRMPPPPGPSYSPDPGYQQQSYSASMPLAASNGLMVPNAPSLGGSPLPETATALPLPTSGSIPNGHQTLGGNYGLQAPSQHGDDGSHIPLQSPASFGFENMVATASYSTGEQAAAGWPGQEGEDGMAATAS